MIEIICHHQQKSLNINPWYEPVCISLEPYDGEFKIELNLEQQMGFEAVCMHMKNFNDSFLQPHFASSYLETANHSSLVLIKQMEEFMFFFCLSHHDQKISLSGHSGGLTLNGNSGKSHASRSKRPALIVLKGTHLHQTIEHGISLALKMTGGFGKLVKEKTAFPPWLQTLGWESGSAFKLKVSHGNIIKAVTSLIASGCKIGFVLIDEGWQHVEDSKLKSFNADCERFPLGLHGLINELDHMGIKHVGVFHGMMGSREGIHEDLAKKYQIEQDIKGRSFLGKHLGQTFEFFYDYYADLKKQGVTFIKVGNQSDPITFQENDVTTVYKNLQAAIQGSAIIQFNNAHFNTDCILNENLYYWTTSNIARVAEDIDLENSGNLMRTIRNMLVNSLWMQHLMLPDFDAWTTTNENSEILAVLHALSGSINVISDVVGDHDKNLLKKIVLPSGKILKSDKPLTICQDSVFCDPIKNKKIYKAFTFKGESGVLAVFNLMEEKCTLRGFVSPKDIEGFTNGRFALLSNHKGFIGCFNAKDKIEMTLKFKGTDVLTFAPVKNGIAVLGCYSFFLTHGLITEINIEDDSMHISMLAASPLMIYCEREIFEVRRNGHAIPWEYNEKRKILCIDSRSNYIDEHSVYTITFE